MISSKKNDEILKAINYINSKKANKESKFSLNDLVKNNNNKNHKKDKHKIKSFRMQEEFGPKKHIKP